MLKILGVLLFALQAKSFAADMNPVKGFASGSDDYWRAQNLLHKKESSKERQLLEELLQAPVFTPNHNFREPFHQRSLMANVAELNGDTPRQCRQHYWMGSYHDNRESKRKKNLNETNTGVGFACRFNENEQYRLWFAFDSIERNSYRRPARIVGVVYEHSLGRIGDFEFFGGAELGYMNYEAEKDTPSGKVRQSIKTLIVVPGLVIEMKKGPMRGFSLDFGRVLIGGVTVWKLSSNFVHRF